jgi:proteasome lid subunit RPN8/RPN11
MILALSRELQDQVRRAASEALPRECCGLIEGTAGPDGIVATALHPAKNIASGPDRFAIDPNDQFRVLRTLRDSGRTLVGCYHSHPNGRAEPSQMDRNGAGEEGFVWLIAGMGDQETQLQAWVWREGEFQSLPIAPT